MRAALGPSGRAPARSLSSPRSLRSPLPSGTGRSKPLPGARGTSWPPPPRVPMEPPNLYPVKLYVYDLSKGLARRLSPIMLGEGAGGGRGGEAWATPRGGCRGVPRMEKSTRGEGRGLRFGPLSPTFLSSRLNPGRRDGGVTPSPSWGLRRRLSPSEPLQLGVG